MAHGELVLGLLDTLVGQLGDVHEALDALEQLDESAEFGQANDLAHQYVAGTVRLEELLQHVRLQLLDAERQPLVLGIDLEDDRLDLVALFEYFARMLDALGPRQVRNVNQAVDSFLDFDEGAEVREVAYRAGDLVADAVFRTDQVPRVGLGLLEAQRQAPSFLVDVEHDTFDPIARVEHFGRVLDTLGPRHLRDVDQPFDALLDFDECAVVGQADDLAANPGVRRVVGRSVLPRIVLQLLEAQRDAFLLSVELQYDDVQFVTDLELLGRMVDATPRNVGDVQQAVDSAEVDECTVLGEILHDSAQDLALFELGEGLLFLGRVFDLEHGFAGQDDVAPALVDLDHAHPVLVTDQALQVTHRANVYERAGQEGRQADVDFQATLDPIDHPAHDRFAGVVGALDRIPDLQALGLFFRQHDVAVIVLGLFQQDIDPIPDGDHDFATDSAEFLDVDDTFGLVPDVDDHFFLEDFQDGTVDDRTFLDCLGAGLEIGEGLSEVFDFLDFDPQAHFGRGFLVLVTVRTVGGHFGGTLRWFGRGWGRVHGRGLGGFAFVGFGSFLLCVHRNWFKPPNSEPHDRRNGLRPLGIWNPGRS